MKDHPSDWVASWWRRSLLLACLGTLASGCGGREQPTESPASQPSVRRQVSVAAAANLKFVLDDVIAAFRHQHAEVEVKAVYGSSGSLFAQLANGAPFDLFLSADVAYPQKLVEQGLASESDVFLYAVGRIAIWVPNSSPLDVASVGIQSLVDPSVQRIAMANPTHAPYGRAAESAMKTLGVYEEVKSRLVLAENITQAAQFVESGAADIGIIALSLALAPPMRDKGRYWEIPVDAYPRIEQAGVILRRSEDTRSVRMLCQFMRGEESRAILRKHGYALPES
ncbi:MAG: molybdate ABC transporter substrate-binding protein [Phycisphaerae bacterium]|nr:molybdate ABC transporter substrate-binding protein [Phycisphaerae bacterium]